MKVYHNHRVEPYFTYVRKGKKNIEVRLRKGKYAEILAGDEIIVQTPDESGSFSVDVVAIRNYASLRELFTSEDLSKVLPNAKDVDDAIALTRKFYAEEDENKYGVVALEVKLK